MDLLITRLKVIEFLGASSSLNRFKGSPTSKEVQLLDATSGDILPTFSSIAESAKFLGILPQTARLRVLKNTRFFFNGKSVYFK